MSDHALSIRRFMRDGATYAVSNILARSTGLILLPILTRHLSPAEYGVVELSAVVFALLNLVLPLEVTQGMARLQADARSEATRSAYLSAAFWFTALMFGAIAVLAWLSPGALGSALFGVTGYERALQLASLAMVATALLYVVQNQLRWNLQSRAYALTNLVLAVVTVTTCIVLVVGLQLRLIGYFLGALAGGACALAVATALAWRRTPLRLRFDVARLREMLGYAAPLVLSSIAVYVTAYADRWIVRQWLGLDSVGQYGAAFRIASIAGVAVSSLQLAITPLVFRNRSDPATALLLRKLLVLLAAVVLPAIGLVQALSEPLLLTLAGPRFLPAAPLLGWLALGVVLMGLYVFAPGMSLAKRTKQIALINLAAALCNVALALALMPVLGVAGAAVAYAAGGLAMLTLYMRGSHALYPIAYPYLTLAFALVAMVAFIAAVHLSAPPLGWRLAGWAVVSASILFALAPGLRGALPPLPRVRATNEGT